MKRPSAEGPKPRWWTCHDPLPAIAPMPVRSRSPLARTTSRPHTLEAWSAYGV